MNANTNPPGSALNRLPLLLALVAAALLVAGCVSSTGDTGKESDIVIRDMKYAPASYTVEAGETVTWVNNDNMGHSITPADKEAWGTEGSGDDPKDWLQKGDSWSHTFTEPGEYKYYCIPHSWQNEGDWNGQVGTIIVERTT